MELCRAVNAPAKIYRDSAAAEDEILAGVVSEADSPTDTKSSLPIGRSEFGESEPIGT